MSDTRQGEATGFSYDTGSFGVDPHTPGTRGAFIDYEAPAVERLVKHAQKALSVGIDPNKIGPWEEALDERQAADFHNYESYRRRLRQDDVSVWDGIDESEANDPLVQAWILDFKARRRNREAVAAMEAYERSWAIQAAYQVYQDRLWLQAHAKRFWAWLREIEVR